MNYDVVIARYGEIGLKSSKVRARFERKLVKNIILTFVARPIAVLISLAPFDIDRPSKAFVSWAGIKGAVPIVFAFYPLVHGIYNAQMIFDIVMVVTCISVLVQGSTLKFMAGHLKVLKEE